MKTLLPITLILTIVFSSCMQVAFLVYGIKQPKPKSKQEIEKHLIKKEIDTNHVYCFTKENLNAYFKDQGGLPRMLIFNKKGEYIPHTPKEDTSACIGDAQRFLKNLDTKVDYETSTERTFSNQFKTLSTLDGKLANIDNLPKADFYVFAYWGTFMGRMNKENLKEWEMDVLANGNSEILLLKVSCDFQDWWEKE